MAYVLIMTAGKLRDPVVFLVQMVTNDTLFHYSAMFYQAGYATYGDANR